MLKTLNSLRLAKNYNFLTFRKTSTNFNFSAIMEKAVEKAVQAEKVVKQERWKVKKERYNGKAKRRDWVPESEEAKRIRLENNPGDRVKRKKKLLLLGFSGVNYCGMQRNPDVRTIEEELLQAMLKQGWIDQIGFDNPQQAFFQRASRTDKGVSAARQVVSLKLPETIDIEAINKDLPEDIRVFAVKKVTKGFNSKTTCDARTYSYTLPTYTFTKDDEAYEDSSFRLSSERFELLNKILGLYVGTKNFHNFTIDKKPQDASAKRFIMSFECQQPYVPDNTEVEFARMKITGQSFMLHQIRRMIGMVIAIMRGYKPAEFIDEALQKERFLVPQAPGLGLVLDNVHYTRYNERYGDDGMHEPLLFKEEDEAVEDFFRSKIMSTIIEAELRDTPMKDWIKRLQNHIYVRPINEEEIQEDKDDKDGYHSD